MVNFSHAYSYRGGNCNCLPSHTARWFPIANNHAEFSSWTIEFRPTSNQIPEYQHSED